MGVSGSSVGILDETYHFFSYECRSASEQDGGAPCGTEDEVISDVKWFPVDEAPLDDVKMRCLLAAKPWEIALFKNIV